jgi:hypothetical protein
MGGNKTSTIMRIWHELSQQHINYTFFKYTLTVEGKKRKLFFEEKIEL